VLNSPYEPRGLNGPGVGVDSGDHRRSNSNDSFYDQAARGFEEIVKN
jgi:hypothetical protein